MAAKGMADKWLEKENLEKLEEWAGNGLFDKQIAHNMGIGIATLYKYKNKYPEIDEAIKRGKEVIDVEVENALYKKCLGYNVKVKKCFKVKNVKYNENGRKIEENEEIVEKEEEVHIPADTTAQIFWLKNRKAKEWRDKISYENENNDVNVRIQNIANLLNNPQPNRSDSDVE